MQWLCKDNGLPKDQQLEVQHLDQHFANLFITSNDQSLPFYNLLTVSVLQPAVTFTSSIS